MKSFYGKYIKRFFEAVGILTCAAALLFLLYPNRLIDTFRFFPKYDPFAGGIEKSVLPVGNGVSSDLSHSQLRKTQLSMSNGSLRNVIVYLPKGYDSDSGRIYPSLYLLHGSPGHETDWIIAGKAVESLDAAIDVGELPPLVAVFFDGNGGDAADTQYINSTDGKQRNEDFVVKTLVSYIDAHFSTIEDPSGRAIGGLSSGGFGAINLALKHQDVFGYVISLSGYGRIDRNLLSNRLIQGSQKTVHDNSPLEYIPDLANVSTKLILIVGRSDTSVISENRELEVALADKGFQVTLTVANGAHNWKFWREHLPDGLIWLGKQLRP